MPYASAGNARIYYEIHGRAVGAAEAIVFAHGLGGNHLSWWQQVPHVRDRYTCVVFDHRGFGQSVDAPDGPGAAAYADDLRCLLDELGIETATLVAQSMGGWTCVQFALRWPERVRRLMLCDTTGGLTSDEIERVAWDVLKASAPPPDGVHPAAGERMLREQPGLHFLYTEIAALTPMTPEGRRAVMQAAGATPIAEAARLRMPVQFVWGEEDIVIPIAALDAMAPHFTGAGGVRVARIAEAGHSVYFERPDAFNAVLDAFLAET